ncbi:biotin--[acetyl-CoA-carboxylase] ligase [Pelagibacterales bacterium SAG-MED05]|nr:biotin--[acetyl-CoA-carboxylase] ligase [Pelagibacterales bacterium SAG-MED05]
MKIKLIKFKSTKSTNDIAIQLIKKNKTQPTLISSEKQTKGRGTMGKKWISQKGNLFISIFFEINQKRINFKQFAILNAFLIRKLVAKFISRDIKIKWPNDLLYKKEKICGILQEVINYNQKNYLIVGIGLNTNISPKNKSFSSTSLKNIINKRIDNRKILKNIKSIYENFLTEIKKFSFDELKKKYKEKK